VNSKVHRKLFGHIRVWRGEILVNRASLKSIQNYLRGFLFLGTSFVLLFLGNFPLWAQSGPQTLHVSGNQVLTSGNCPVTLRGVDIDSLEWYDGSPNPPGEGPPNGSGGSILESVQAAVTQFHVNIIRLPLNQDFWFGCGGAGAATYTGTVQNIVNYCSQNNVYV
jgi:hypothetical protein